MGTVDKKNNRQSDSLLKGALILSVGGMVVKVIGFLNWIILSRVLGGEGIGLYQMAFPIYLLALSLSSAGIPVAISIITAEKVAHGDYQGANRVFTLSLKILALSGFVLSCGVYFGAGWLIENQIIRDPRAYSAIVALAPAIFFVTMLSSFRGYLQGWQMMTPTAVSQIVEQLFRVGAMLIFASLLLPQGLEYAAGGASMGAGAGAVAGLLVLIFYYFRLQRNLVNSSIGGQNVNSEGSAGLVRRMVKLAFPVSMASLMLPVVSNLDLFIVPVRLEAAGYSVEEATELFGYLTGMAVPLLNLATIITAALATSLVPGLAEVKSIGNKLQIKQRTAAAVRLALLVTVPASMGLAVLATPLASAVYHAPEAGPIVQIVAAGVCLLGIHQVSTGILQGLGHTTLPVVNMGAAALVKVGLNWTLTARPELGILGSAWATNADIGVAAVLNMVFVYRYTGFRLNFTGAVKIIVAAIVMSSVLFEANSVILRTVDALTAIFADMIIAMGVYGVVLLFLGELTEQDLQRIPVAGRYLVRFAYASRLYKR